MCREVLSGVEREICMDCLSSLPLTYFWSYRNNPAEELFWGKVYFQRACSLFSMGMTALTEGLFTNSNTTEDVK